MPPTARVITDVQLHQEPMDVAVLQTVTPAEAWTHMLLPMRSEDGCLIVAVTHTGMAQARTFLASKGLEQVCFLLCEPVPLEQCIACCYDYEGLEGGSGSVPAAA